MINVKPYFHRLVWIKSWKSVWKWCGKSMWKNGLVLKFGEKCGKVEGCTHFLHGDLHEICTSFFGDFVSVLAEVLHGFHIAYYYYY